MQSSHLMYFRERATLLLPVVASGKEKRRMYRKFVPSGKLREGI